MTTAPVRASGEREPRPAEQAARPARAAGKGTGVRRAAALLNPRTVQQLQRGVGNRAVASLASRSGGAPTASLSAEGPRPAAPAVERELVETPSAITLQRKEGGGDCPPPPVPPSAPDPHADPKFAKVKGAVASSAKTAKSHPPAKGEVDKAQAAANAPSDDKAKQAKAGQVAEMAAAKPKGFDKAAFIAAVKTAIAKAAPANLDEADKFASSGKAEAVKGEVMSKVGQGKEGSAKDVKENTDKPPDTSAAKEKPVTPLAPPPPAKVPPVDGAKAMPAKAPAEQTNLKAGPCDVNSTMAEAGVSEKQLEKSNEPDMKGAVDAKKEAEAHAAEAPGAIREKEAQTLQGAQAEAAGGAKNAVGLLGVAKKAALGKVGADKSAAKSKDEAARARISGEVNRIFDATKTEVTTRLNELDGKVTTAFETGEAEARREFTAYHKTEMEKYKDDRYSGALGWARWLDDQFTDLPAEANQIFVRAKALYENKMTAVISKVADLIGTELDAAKARIALGRKQIDDFIAKEPKDLQKVAREASADVKEKFGELEADVDSKQESLVEDLATKYVEARNAVDEEIKAEQEKNKGFVSKAKDAVVGAIETILKLKNLFMTVLAKAASALTLILDDPVKFITNFMNAVKQGLNQFVGNIWKHLKAGLLGWLFGALADAGIEIPATFDLKGILQLIGSIFGLTLTNLKNRLVKAAPWIGTAIDFVMDKIEIIKVLVTKGISGVWDWIKDKLGDLKSMIMTPIIEFVKEKIITAGISWILGLLNPAGALVKIVQGLVGVVSWILERGQSLMEFISTVIDAVTDIAKGGVGGVPDKIEASLAKAVPLVISFLANLLGLGGISDKVKKVMEIVQKPVNKAIDWLIKKGLALARPLITKLKGMAAKVKGKILGGDDSPEGKEQRLNKGMKAGLFAADKFAGKYVGDKVLRPILNLVKMRYGLGVLEPVKQGDNWAVHGEVNRIVQRKTPKTSDTRRSRASTKEKDKKDDKKDPTLEKDLASLKADVKGAGDMYKFLIALRKAGQVGKTTIALFIKLMDYDPGWKYIASKFRGTKNQHEWIPTDQLDVVLTRKVKAGAAGVKEAAHWINLHHHLRSPTHAVIWSFKADKKSGEVEIGGHVGSLQDLNTRVERAQEKVDKAKTAKDRRAAEAVLEDAKKERKKAGAKREGALEDAYGFSSATFSTSASDSFHNRLRAMFTGSATPAAYVTKIRAFVRGKGLWSGSLSDIPVRLRNARIGEFGLRYHKDNGDPLADVTFAELAKYQAAEVDRIKADIDAGVAAADAG